jgi:hypothetical protein
VLFIVPRFSFKEATIWATRPSNTSLLVIKSFLKLPYFFIISIIDFSLW